MTQPTWEDPPNVEAIVVAALRADDRVASVVAARVYGDRPAAATDPMLVVHRAGGAATGDWLEDARIQVDAWGTSRTDAFAAANAAVAALRRLTGVYSTGVVTGTDRTTGPQWFPDPVTDRPRYLTEFVVHAHPLAQPLSAS